MAADPLFDEQYGLSYEQAELLALQEEAMEDAHLTNEEFKAKRGYAR